jgi:hypothetical protein
MAPPRLRVAPLGAQRTATVRWDGESSTMVATIRSSDPRGGHPAQPSLRETIDAALHIEEPARTAVIGGADLMLDAEDRPTSIELYTSPARWIEVPRGGSGVPPDLAGPAAGVEEADVALDLEYDPNWSASADVPLSVERDAARGSVTLRFGDREVQRWYAPAQGLLVGADDEGRLSALRFERVAGL